MCLHLTPNNWGKMLLKSNSLKGRSVELNHYLGVCSQKTDRVCWQPLLKTFNCQFELSHNRTIQLFNDSLSLHEHLFTWPMSTLQGVDISSTMQHWRFKAQRLLFSMIFSIHVTHKFGDYLTMALGLMQSAFWTVFEGQTLVRTTVNCQESL